MALNTEDLRNLTKDELNMKLAALKTDLFGLRFQAESGRIEKPNKIKEIRRDIARINTILREKEGESKNASSPKQA